MTISTPVDDILFSLQHVAGGDRLDGWNKADSAAVLGHFHDFATAVIAPLNAVGDAEGARLEQGRVRMPTGFSTAYEQLAENGWQGLSAPEEYGGMAASPLIAAGVSELFSAANHAMQMVCNLVPGAITTLRRYGTADQQQRWIPQLASGDALSTMCLTEPQAGSDLSAIRTNASETEDGWAITGEKIFISGGDQDMSKGILHLVLARTGPASDGIRGLSLFLCPAQSGVSVSRLEDKLGLHASPTCHMRFDEAKAELVGERGGGLNAMFTLMNHARLDVALQGVAHASRVAKISRDYADERRQGRLMNGQSAHLSDHADIARMLDRQQQLAMGARAMCHTALVTIEAGDDPALGDFLTPLCKIFGSQAGIEAADLGIQILGGYGYLRDYGIEQHWRDARITAIYEGANGIHERSIATRGLRADGGSVGFARLISQLADGHTGILADLAAWEAEKTAMITRAETSTDPSAGAHGFAQNTCNLFYRACWAKIAGAAAHHPHPETLTRLAASLL